MGKEATAATSASGNEATAATTDATSSQSGTFQTWKDKACRVCDSFDVFRKSMKGSTTTSSTSAGLQAREAHSAAVGASPGQTDRHAHADDSAQASGEPANAAGPTSAAATASAEEQWTAGGKLPCPPDYTELGNSSWAFLHTVAAYYPEEPDDKAQAAARQLMDAVSHLYPCESCAEHLRGELQKQAPQVNSRLAFEQYLCRLHNEVNVRLGKAPFDCSRVGERWRDGPQDGDCI